MSPAPLVVNYRSLIFLLVHWLHKGNGMLSRDRRDRRDSALRLSARLSAFIPSQTVGTVPCACPSLRQCALLDWIACLTCLPMPPISTVRFFRTLHLPRQYRSSISIPREKNHHPSTKLEKYQKVLHLLHAFKKGHSVGLGSYFTCVATLCCTLLHLATLA